MKNIWNNRCNQILQWEKTQHITRKEKRRKKPKIFTKTIDKTNNTNLNLTEKTDIINKLIQKWIQDYVQNGHNIHNILN